MKNNLSLSVFEIVGGSVCAFPSDGQRVYDRLAVAIRENRKIEFSFRNITTLTPAFLNAAIGQLYGAFNEAEIRALLYLNDIDPADLALVKRITENARQYFSDSWNNLITTTERSDSQ